MDSGTEGRFIGVYRTRSGRFRASIWTSSRGKDGALVKRSCYLGTFDTPEDAAEAYDRAVPNHRPGSPTNFGPDAGPRPPRGVYPNHGRWAVRLWDPARRKLVNYGSYPTREAAIVAKELVMSQTQDREKVE